MKKRLLALLLAVVMVAAMIPASVFADNPKPATWTYEEVTYKNVTAIKATKKVGGEVKDVQYLYATVSEDLTYDNNAFAFVGTKEAEGKYVRLMVDEEGKGPKKETKTRVLVSEEVQIDKADEGKYTKVFADGIKYDDITTYFKSGDKHLTEEEPPKNAGNYEAKFYSDKIPKVKDGPYYVPLKGLTAFTIEPMGINEDAILKSVEKQDFYFTGVVFDQEDLFKEMGITLQDSRIVEEDESLRTLVEGEDYTLTLVGVATEEGYKDFDYTREYVDGEPAYVLVKGVNNYNNTYAISVIFEKPVVSFDANGGTPDYAVKVDYLTAVAKPEDPTREGYKFAGWYTDEELTEAYDFETLVVEDTQLYAKWVANVNTGVTSNSNMTMIIAGGMILLAVALAVVVLKRRASQK